jgi:hypothetical protein
LKFFYSFIYLEKNLLKKMHRLIRLKTSVPTILKQFQPCARLATSAESSGFNFGKIFDWDKLSL